MFMIFLILVTCKRLRSSFVRQKFAILVQSRVILRISPKLIERARCIVICINPAVTKMIDETEKPKTPLKFAKRAA